jgi:hypothetical protein
MANKTIQYNLDQALGPKSYYNLTTAATYYPLSTGGGGILERVIIGKGFTGTVALVDQAKVASASSILSGQATSATTVTIVPAASLVAQPTYPRRLVVTPGGTTADVAACSVTIEGTDVSGVPISEDFAFLANASTATNGTLRFKTIEQITFPVQDGGSATFSVGALAGDTIATITNPSAGQVYEFNVALQEGLAVTNSATGDITVVYLE